MEWLVWLCNPFSKIIPQCLRGGDTVAPLLQLWACALLLDAPMFGMSNQVRTISFCSTRRRYPQLLLFFGTITILVSMSSWISVWGCCFFLCLRKPGRSQTLRVSGAWLEQLREAQWRDEGFTLEILTSKCLNLFCCLALMWHGSKTVPLLYGRECLNLWRVPINTSQKW